MNFDSILQITSSKECLGTGFVVKQDTNGIFIATCGHVLKTCDEQVLVDGKVAKVIKNEYSKGLDIAILYVEGLIRTPLTLNPSLSPTTVRVVGYSKFLDAVKKEPINSIPLKKDVELSKFNKTIKIFKLHPSENISHGYSGSPVICEDTNQVIGIVALQEGLNTNYAISIEHLLEIFPINISSQIMPLKQTKKSLITNLKEGEYEIIKRELENNFEESLLSYSGLPKVWIKPRVHTIEEASNVVAKEDTKINLSDIVKSPKSIFIKARHQYGLTSLSHYLIKEAWLNKTPSYWLYLDSKELKPHFSEIQKTVEKKLKAIALSFEDIECVILDEFSTNLKDANKILNKVNEYFKAQNLIIMMTMVENPLVNESITLPEERQFYQLHLWSLPRHDIREVVAKYNDVKYIGDENDVLNKVISDLDVLNIPRTVLNCLTLLKISEQGFDDSPVNRTDMLWRILSLLFNVEDIPRYKTKPDLKDTEYILGYLCEVMIKENNYYFTRENFLKILNDFCKEREIDLDVDVIFDVLYKNHILVQAGNQFRFKFSYWIFYFAAQRMHQNQEFANFIFQDMNYVSYPELIEFYTGIDRRRDDALKILIHDIKETRQQVERKCGLPSEFNLYDFAKWKPSEDDLAEMKEEVSSKVLNSSLPETVKDQYADRTYDCSRPLNQSIYKIFEEYSLLRLMKSIQAGSKALRNSDYSRPEVRHDLLNEILLSWEQITKVLLILAPILAKQGYANLEGASFVVIDNDFDLSEENKFFQIIGTIPSNVVNWYENDLFSKKMGSLIYNHLASEKNNLLKHVLNILIAHKKPKDWHKSIEEYIEKESKNSFYLLDIFLILQAEYKYSFASDGDLRLLEKLIKMILAKHELGIKKPNQKVIKKVPDSVLPTRDHELDNI